MNEKTRVNDGNGGSVPLREYIERMLDERDKAVKVAVLELQRRLDELNQLRTEVTTDRSQFVRMDVYDEKHETLENMVRDIERHLNQTFGSRLNSLESWRLKAVGVNLVLVPLAGLIGAAIMKAFG